MNISIGNDHAGVEFKEAIIQHLEKKGNVLKNHGTNDESSVDYPDFIHPVAKDVQENRAMFGIIICGSGNGAAMTANKHQKIRTGLCWNKETAHLTRQHNDANILSLPARFISLDLALEIVDIFIETPFEGGRHQKRVNKIACS